MAGEDEIGVSDPEELEAAGAPASGAIAAATTLGPVHVTVSDLERSLAFFRDSVGLQVLGREDGTASIGAGERELIVAVEEPGAGPGSGYTGLYHVALLLPQRADLARWLAHAAHDQVPLTGLSDHFVSEALYLSDPDGHGIEIYWDRPRESWEGQVAARMTTLPLDVDGLMAAIGDPAAGFDDQRRQPVRGRVDGGGEAGRAGADDDEVVVGPCRRVGEIPAGGHRLHRRGFDHVVAVDQDRQRGAGG